MMQGKTPDFIVILSDMSKNPRKSGIIKLTLKEGEQMTITNGMLKKLSGYPSEHTVEKYIRNVRRFSGFVGGEESDKPLVPRFKESLQREMLYGSMARSKNMSFGNLTLRKTFVSAKIPIPAFIGPF